MPLIYFARLRQEKLNLQAAVTTCYYKYISKLPYQFHFVGKMSKLLLL